MPQQKKIILLFIDYYLPGYRAGGPVRTVANMVESLGNEFSFHIVTRDRDLTKSEPYKNITPNCWNKIGKASVLYLDLSAVNAARIASILRDVTYDILYFNSYFSFRFTILPLMIHRFIFFSKKTIVLAPRGEFGKSALKFKLLRKFAYIIIAKLLRVHDNIFWQASSRFEISDISRAIGRSAVNIHLAPDLLAPLPDIGNNALKLTNIGPNKILNVVFISRICPIKNLDFLLEAIEKITGTLALRIYGPVEDKAYWNKCKKIIARLDSSKNVTYNGEINPESVCDIFSAHDLFVFPSKGENFGHVIFEALSAGTSVIVSDNTPWAEDGSCALKVLPLSNISLWSQAVEDWTNFSTSDFLKQREEAYLYAKAYIARNDTLGANRKLFNVALAYSDAR